MKTCSVCHQPKPLESFYRTPQSYDGYAGVCRHCIRSRTKQQGTKAEKQCARCGEVKPIEEFHKNKARGDGVSPYCAPCTRHYANTYYRAKAHDLVVSKVFGIPRGEYARMLEAQSGRCAVCHRAEWSMFGANVKKLAVDHDHKTGKVRELLCNRCNTVIGRAEDNILLLQE